MTDSSYIWRPDFDHLTATGYDAKGVPGDLEKPKEAGAASTLNTTARDYALFVDAILNGKGLSPSTLHEMETPQNCTRSELQDLHQARAEGAVEKSVLGIGLGHTAQKWKHRSVSLGRQWGIQGLCHDETHGKIRRGDLR
jgi:CubicO group peptidase (beta-lactamase class C family)